MTAYRDRLVRAIKLDPELYEEVEADHTANGQAVLTVLLSSLAAGVGGALSGGWYGLLLHTVVALVGWLVWAFLSFFIGSKLLPEKQTQADMGELLRCTGFSSAPGLLQVFGFLPGLGGFIRLGVAVWMLAAFVIAVRQALDYTSTYRALGVCVIGWAILMALNVILFIMSLGRFTL
ncbi:MAG: hypothetical protein JWP91_3928 [Fibrobacteres bacterium]|nr:hypothetical protein [Fibrobacterota bacterium]